MRELPFCLLGEVPQKAEKEAQDTDSQSRQHLEDVMPSGGKLAIKLRVQKEPSLFLCLLDVLDYLVKLPLELAGIVAGAVKVTAGSCHTLYHPASFLDLFVTEPVQR